MNWWTRLHLKCMSHKRKFGYLYDLRNSLWHDDNFTINTNDVKLLTPFDTEKFFFEDELAEIEKELNHVLYN